MAPQSELTWLPETQILLVHSTGLLSPSLWPVIIKSSIDEGRKYSCRRYLIDNRDAEFRFKFAEVWALPRNKGEFELPKDARIALLLRPSLPLQKEFIEAFNSNRGFRLKVFLDKAAAISWLVESPPEPNLFAFP